jgi:tetratricopeptide (TPR) repeat protein
MIDRLVTSINPELDELQPKAEELSALEAEHYCDLGEASYELNHYKRAVIYLDKSIDVDPMYIKSYRYRARAKAELEDFHGAIEDWDRCIMLDRGDLDNYQERATIKRRLGDYHGAIEDWSQYISLDPENTYGYSERAEVKQEMGDRQGAIADYHEAIKCCNLQIDNKQGVGGYIKRADLKHKMGDCHGAIAEYKHIIIRYGSGVLFIHKKLESVSYELGGYHKIIKSYDDLIAAKPENHELYTRRASAKQNLKDYNGAIEDLGLCIAVDPKSRMARLNQAIIRYKYLQDYNEAIEDCDQLISVDPLDDIYYYIRADIKQNLKDYNGAIEDLNLCIAINHNNSAAHSMIAEIKLIIENC